MAQPYIDPRLPQNVKDLITKGSPYALDAVVPDLSMMYANHPEFDEDTLAGVSSRLPTTVMFNPGFKGDMGMYQQTIPHEFEHVLQNQSGERYPGGYDAEVVRQYAQANPTTNTPRANLITNLDKAATNKELLKHLTARGFTPSPYLGNYGSGMSLREQFADLSGLEQANKVDLTQDPMVRKHFFNDDQAFVDTYRATTGLRTNRLDAKDLAPMSVTNQAQGPYRPPPEPSYLDMLSKMFSK